MKARRAGLVLLAVGLAAAALAWPARARAEYRAYELEITDVLDCKLNKREKCRTGKVVTSMSPDLYVQTNGGEDRIGILMVATWMCYGDTSGYKEVCPRPPARNPKFAAGEDVRIALKKHITDGWRGKVEVVYYQEDIRANVYGVRFPERQNAYLRYFEKDLAKSAPVAAGAAGAPGAPSAAPGVPSAAPQGAPAAAPVGTPPAVPAPPAVAPTTAPGSAQATAPAAAPAATPGGAPPSAPAGAPAPPGAAPTVTPAAAAGPATPAAPAAAPATAPTPPPAGPRTEPPR